MHRLYCHPAFNDDRAKGVPEFCPAFSAPDPRKPTICHAKMQKGLHSVTHTHTERTTTQRAQAISAHCFVFIVCASRLGRPVPPFLPANQPLDQCDSDQRQALKKNACCPSESPRSSNRGPCYPVLVDAMAPDSCFFNRTNLKMSHTAIHSFVIHCLRLGSLTAVAATSQPFNFQIHSSNKKIPPQRPSIS